MKASRHSSSTRLAACFLAFAFIAGALVVSGAEVAQAYTLKVRIDSLLVAKRKNVDITVAGGDLTTPQVKKTNDLGLAKFRNLNAGTYVATPSRDGWRYVPEFKEVTFSGDVLAQRAVFKPFKLPAAASISLDKSEMTLQASYDGFVLATIKTAKGKGIARAPFTASSNNTAVATVAPLADKANMNGEVILTITAGYTPGNAVITITSGGWRGTAVVSATINVTVDAGFGEGLAWSGSAHADAASEPFRHWDSTGVIPVGCAKCHSKWGFLDYIGADGTAAGVVDNPAATGTVIDCYACHDPLAFAMTSVTFPSNTTVTGLGREAICATCHQGTAAGATVDKAITDAGIVDPDALTTLSFINIHYFSAAATFFGTEAKGGYEYPGKIYDRRLAHVASNDTCLECHDPHSLQAKFDECAACHAGVIDGATARTIRMAASYLDYDGDGNTTEGIAAEIDGLAGLLLTAIQTYATGKGFPIAYSGTSYPYWFNDANANGAVDAGETRYNHWTARLLKAGFNYQNYVKEPCGFVHNPRYVIELLYDSIEDVAGAAAVVGLVRNDVGHFDSTSIAFRDWDADVGGVSAGCSKCHSAGGFDYYISNGFTPSPVRQPVINRLTCEVCHSGFSTTAPLAPRKYVAQIVFPFPAATGPATVLYNAAPASADDSFICMTCHAGRQSNATLRATLGAKPLDTIDATISLSNVHYAATAGSVYGAEAKVAYEYDGMVYVEAFKHADPTDPAKCSSCHGVTAAEHWFFPRISAICALCHTETTAGALLSTIRKDRPTDYNGNGNTTESLKAELDTLAAALLAAIQAEATANTFPIVLLNNRFFEADGTTTYAHWTPRMMRAAFNLNYYNREPGCWAHNTDYWAQILWDSITDLGGSTVGFNVPGRP